MSSSRTELEAAFERLPDRRILVVGDLMLDRYLWGDVGRISPEAPVPVVQLRRTMESPGGAGNVVSNLASLGVRVTAGGCVGDDEAGRVLIAGMQRALIDVSGIVRIAGHTTTVKTRVVGDTQQLVRIDEEQILPTGGYGADLRRALEEHLDERLDAVIVSDYAKGTISLEICTWLIERARELGITLIVDPKGSDYGRYAGATGITPNESELALATGMAVETPEQLAEAANWIRAEIGVDFVLVTSGSRGMTLFGEDVERHFPATVREVFDVSGAGDTAIATLTAMIVAGLPLHPAALIANRAAGIVVAKLGTRPVRLQELLDEATVSDSAERICSLELALERVRAWRERGDRIVFTNGCFDLLHVGHVASIEQARRAGDRLVIGLNSDRSVRAIKAPPRPLIPQEERARILAALEAVDAVVAFDQDTPLDLIRAIRPDVLVKGADYEEDDVVGAAEVQSWGGEVLLAELLPGSSTSKILQRIKNSLE